MEWLRLKEYGMKNTHIKKLMLIFQDFEELFYEENFKLFNDELKNQLEEAMKIDLKARLELYERNRVRIISANDKEYPKKLKEIKDFPVFLYLKGKKTGKSFISFSFFGYSLSFALIILTLFRS